MGDTLYFVWNKAVFKDNVCRKLQGRGLFFLAPWRSLLIWAEMLY